MFLFRPTSFLIVVATLGFVIRFFYNMQQALNSVSPKNRAMDGGMVWLNFVPLLNFVWVFIFNNALQTSYRKEFKEKGIHSKVDLGSGIVYPVLNLAMFIFPLFAGFFVAATNQDSYQVVEDLNDWSTIVYVIFGFGTLAMWIVFWNEVMALKNILLVHSDYGRNNHESTHSNNFNTHSNKVNTSGPILSSGNSDRLSQSAFPKIKQQNDSHKKESTVEKIKKYHEMFSEGLISEEDFNTIKKQILEDKNGR